MRILFTPYSGELVTKSFDHAVRKLLFRDFRKSCLYFPFLFVLPKIEISPKKSNLITIDQKHIFSKVGGKSFDKNNLIGIRP